MAEGGERRRGPRGQGRNGRPGRQGRRDDRDGPGRPGNRGRQGRSDGSSRPGARGDRPREAAYRVLRAVDENGAYANLELPRVLRDLRLGGRDAAFATELCHGTLRLQGRYDAVIAEVVDPGRRHIDPPIRDLLRLGAHQLLGMRVAEHAAVASTVDLARTVLGQGRAGFVNALLRRIAERDLEEWSRVLLDGVEDPVERLALWYSHPSWIARALRAALLADGVPRGEVEGELAGLLEAQNTPGPVALVARPGLGAESELESAGAVPSPTTATAWELPGGDPGAIAAVREGRAAVQDAGSQVLATALAQVPVEGADEHWLDLCAGPGGKAGLLAALARERGAHLRANEVSDHRADLVRRTLSGALEAGASVEVTVGDGREVGTEEPGRYDRVLVDAPCTGLGSLRRRPEARWRRTPQDLPPLSALQRELLESALDATRPGGVVAYGTCSPHLVETRTVVRDVLRARDDVEAVDAGTVRDVVRNRAGEPLVDPTSAEEPWVQLWPHRHGTDGMFLALLRRR